MRKPKLTDFIPQREREGRRAEQRSRQTILQRRGITLATPTHSQSRERARRLRQIATKGLRP